MENFKVKVFYIMVMAMYIKVPLRKIKRMVKVNYF